MTFVMWSVKNNKAECGGIFCHLPDVHCGIKILAQVILSCVISSNSEEYLPESQCGFRPGCNTIDMFFSLRQAQEKCIEQPVDCYAVFINLTKDFNGLNWEALWGILTKLSCTWKFIHIIWFFYDDMIGLILPNSDTSTTFNISNGMKQDFVLAPVLFNLFFTWLLIYTLCDSTSRVYLRNILDTSLLTSDGWMQEPGLLGDSLWMLCLLMTAISWHTWSMNFQPL